MTEVGFNFRSRCQTCFCSVFAQMNHVCSLASQAGRFPQEPTVEAPASFLHYDLWPVCMKPCDRSLATSRHPLDECLHSTRNSNPHEAFAEPSGRPTPGTEWGWGGGTVQTQTRKSSMASLKVGPTGVSARAVWKCKKCWHVKKSLHVMLQFPEDPAGGSILFSVSVQPLSSSF